MKYFPQRSFKIFFIIKIENLSRTHEILIFENYMDCVNEL
jgi:hypothetical protein